MRNTLLILVAISSGLFCACTSVVRRTIEEASARQSKYDQHQINISAVVTRDIDTVFFDSLGGLYDEQSNTLVGISNMGTPVGFTLSNMRMIHVVSEAGSVTEMKPRKISKRYRHLPREKIEGLKLIASDSLIKFSKYGGWVHSPGQMVVNSLQGEQPPQTYTFDEIEFVLVRRTSTAKTAGLVVGVLVLTSSVLYMIFTPFLSGMGS